MSHTNNTEGTGVSHTNNTEGTGVSHPLTTLACHTTTIPTTRSEVSTTRSEKIHNNTIREAASPRVQPASGDTNATVTDHLQTLYSVITSGGSLVHSRGAGARSDSFALNTTAQQGRHSAIPLGEGCGTDSHREVTDSPPLVPKGSNGSEVSMKALVHVSRPGVDADSEEELEGGRTSISRLLRADVDPGPPQSERCVQPAPLDVDGCRLESAFSNFADASEEAQTNSPGTDSTRGTVHAPPIGGRPVLDSLQDPDRAARPSADDGPRSPTEVAPSSCTKPHGVHVLGKEETDQLHEAPGLPSTSSNDVTSSHVASTSSSRASSSRACSSCTCTGVFDSVTKKEIVDYTCPEEHMSSANATTSASPADLIDAIPELAQDHDLLSMSPFDGNDIFDDDTESSTSSSSRDTHVLDLHTTSPDHVDTSTFDDRVPTLEGLDLAMNASTSVSTSHENYTRLDEEARVIHWLLDTGANESITNVPGILDRIKRRRIHLQGISEKPVIIDKIGTITGSIRDTNGIDQKISLDDVCYSEKSHMNLLATSSLVNEGAIIHLEQGNCYLQLSHGADASHGMGGAACHTSTVPTTRSEVPTTRSEKIPYHSHSDGTYYTIREDPRRRARTYPVADTPSIVLHHHHAESPAGP